MAYQYIRFSLSSPYLEKLQSQCKDDESIHLTSKRLLLEFLGNGESRESPIDSTELEDLKTRLDELETRMEEPLPQFDELEDIKTRLESLEAAREAASQPSTINHQPSQSLQPTGTSTAAGLTHSQLAKKLGVNKSTTARWVKKGVSPDGAWEWDGTIWKVREL